jgi:hypothetical protein
LGLGDAGLGGLAMDIWDFWGEIPDIGKNYKY